MRIEKDNFRINGFCGDANGNKWLNISPCGSPREVYRYENDKEYYKYHSLLQKSQTDVLNAVLNLRLDEVIYMTTVTDEDLE